MWMPAWRYVMLEDILSELSWTVMYTLRNGSTCRSAASSSASRAAAAASPPSCRGSWTRSPGRRAATALDRARPRRRRGRTRGRGRGVLPRHGAFRSWSWCRRSGWAR